ncbi:MAG: RHS repeat-associated core domain-containing protein, partial [Maribacter sp.]|nr:RHS repeat-associated core domain-containing protein [Maribacter sp.]
DGNRDYAQVIAETDDLNTINVEYIYGDDLIGQDRQASGYSYYLYDGLGSTRYLTDSLGTVTDSYDYDAFGIELNRTGVTDNDYLFAREQFDSALDNYYLRARYYDPGVGRFTQMDEWMGNNSDPVTLHKYLYANVDPVNTIDPTGNFGLSDISASLNISGRLSTIATASGRASIQNALVGRASKETFGLIGEEIISLAKQALVDILLQEAGGKSFFSAATKGSAAHKQFEELVKKINGKYKRYGFRIAAEVFRIEKSGSKVKGRKKGALGIDVAVISTGSGKTVLAFDLKTGRGSSKKRNGRLSTVFDGADIIEILVSKKKK